MKTRNNCFHVLLFIVFADAASAATNPWIGDTNNVFTNNLNWTGDALPNFGTDIMRFDGPGIQGNSTITGVNLTMTNTGTAAGTSLAQILFSGSTPALTLSGGTITLGTAATNTYNNAITLSSGSTVTQTIGSNLVIGTGTTYTASVVNASTSGTGALLAFSGNISGGTGGTAGIISLGFGNTATHNGDYSVSGNISAGGSTGINITKRGTGVLTLTGTNSLGTGAAAGGLAQNEAGTIRINGGTTSVNNQYNTGNAFGGNNVASTLQISSGNLTVNEARSIRNNLLVDGGTFNIGNASGGRLSLDSGRSFNMTSGAINVNSTTGSFGVRFGGDSGPGSGGFAFAGTQSGGTFTVNGAGGQDSTFQLGSTSGSITSSYALSGGTLDIKGSNSTNGHLTLGADAAGTSATTFTLSGTGKLMVRSTATGGLGISGRTASAVQNFDFNGGTLVAGEITTADLRRTGNVANGLLTNAGGTLAPGDIGITGRTTVTGDYMVTTGLLAIDIGGLAAATNFQEGALSGKFDQLLITGNFTAGGTLGLNLVDTYNPASSDIFKIVDLTGAGTLSGFFSNVVDGGTLTTLGNEGSFRVYSSGNDVFLTDFTAIPEPRAALLAGLGMLALLRRRRAV